MAAASACLLTLFALFTGACASSGVKPRSVAPTPAQIERDGLVGTALALQGAPYRNGGSDPNGFDCSGFTQWVFAQHGIALPREVREQFELGKRVKSDKVLPGDLLFFHTVERGPSHVGIAIGPDAFVHAPSSRGVVRIERVSADYWSRRLIGIRRIDF
jgi:cell wall-associated NlpC family hydrolase